MPKPEPRRDKWSRHMLIRCSTLWHGSALREPHSPSGQIREHLVLVLGLAILPGLALGQALYLDAIQQDIRAGYFPEDQHCYDGRRRGLQLLDCVLGCICLQTYKFFLGYGPDQVPRRQMLESAGRVVHKCRPGKQYPGRICWQIAAFMTP